MQVAVSVRVKDLFKEDLPAPKPHPKRAWLRLASVFFEGPSKGLPTWPSPSPLTVRPDFGLLERPLRRPNRTKPRSGATVRRSSLRGLRKALQLHPNHNQQNGFSSGSGSVSVRPSSWCGFRCNQAFFFFPEDRPKAIRSYTGFNPNATAKYAFLSTDLQFWRGPLCGDSAVVSLYA